MRKKLLTASVLIMVVLGMAIGPALAQDVGVESTVYDASLTLENKGANWDVIGNDSIGGTLWYNESGSKFEFAVEATVSQASTKYALIYYADYEPRFDDWGGDNPGAVITTAMSNSTKGLVIGNSSVELGMDLPWPTDANIYYYNYADSNSGNYTGDDYDTAHGAKIWLVPTSDLTSNDSLPLDDWNRSNYLFETDLINYDDTDVAPTVSLTVNPTAIDFGPLTPGTLGDGGNVEVKNTGDGHIKVTASVGGAGLFDNLKLDGSLWSDYTVWMLEPSDSVTPSVELDVPGDFPGRGAKSGTLTFTATPEY